MEPQFLLTIFYLEIISTISSAWLFKEDTDSTNKDNNFSELFSLDSRLGEDNPCSNKNSTKPDFSKLGRRISQTKCYDYVWNLKDQEEIKQRRKSCPNKFFHIAVVGGFRSAPGEFPHMGAVGWKSVTGEWLFKCGSTLISSNFVLTAGHCISVSPRDTTVADVVPKIVRLGDINILDNPLQLFPPNDLKIIRIIKHPQYKPPKKYNDIALMELERHVEFTENIHPACLWIRQDTSPLGEQATVSGWGVTKSGNSEASPALLAGVVDIVDSVKCDTLLRPSCNRQWCGVQEHQLCAGKLTGGVDACQGDSGGPLQVKIPLPISGQSMYYVIGVTSFGIGCALPNLPGVYTRVSSAIDWIEDVVWK